MKNYLSCRLELNSRTHAVLNHSEAQYEGSPDFSDEKLEELAGLLEENEQKYGEALFAALFPPKSELRKGVDSAFSMILQNGPGNYDGLRFRLLFGQLSHDSATLLDQSWEHLRHESIATPFACAQNVLISRSQRSTLPSSNPLTNAPRVLIVVAVPDASVSGTRASFDPGEIKDELEKTFRGIDPPIEYEIMQEPATLANLRKRLEDGFEVLHIQAYGLMSDGDAEAGLVLEDDHGEADIISEDRLVEALDGLNLRLVTLMVCFSGARPSAVTFKGLGQSLVDRGIPAVVAMQKEISEKGATCFNDNFYSRLGSSGLIDLAMNSARMQMRMTTDGEWAVPLLFMRLEDGRVWPSSERVAKTRRHLTRGASRGLSPGTLSDLGTTAVLPILGPGMSEGVLPADSAIAERWAQRFGCLVNAPSSLPRVAQFLDLTQDGDGFVRRLYLSEMILSLGEAPEGTHPDELVGWPIDRLAEEAANRTQATYENAAGADDAPRLAAYALLAEIACSHEGFDNFITTMPDGLMAHALASSSQPRRAERIYCEWHDPQRFESMEDPEKFQRKMGTAEEPMIFHLFGSAEHPDALVITEDDYLDYFEAMVRHYNSLVPSDLRTKIDQSHLLFLGFDISQLRTRMLLKSLIELSASDSPRRRQRRGERTRLRFVVQIDPATPDLDEQRTLLQRLFRQYCREYRLEMFQGTLVDMLTELRRVRAEA